MTYRDNVYDGTSQLRKTERRSEKGEQRKLTNALNNAKRKEFDDEVDAIVGEVESHIEEVAQRHHKHPDSVRLSFGGRGGEHKKSRAPNPVNGWAKVKAAELNEGKHLHWHSLALC